MFNKKLKVHKVLLLLLFLWIVISITRTLYNSSKLYTEERNWYKLSDEEKRGKFFGDTNYFLRFLDENTSNKSKILFYTNDLKAHYLGRYYLYPAKEIIAEHDYYLWFPKKDIYDYIAIYPVNYELVRYAKDSSNISKFREIATYKGRHGQLGVLYKK